MAVTYENSGITEQLCWMILAQKRGTPLSRAGPTLLAVSL